MASIQGVLDQRNSEHFRLVSAYKQRYIKLATIVSELWQRYQITKENVDCLHQIHKELKESVNAFDLDDLEGT